MSFSFQVLEQASDNRARLGRLQTKHGTVDTPAFMPVGTQATVKTLTPDELKKEGAEIVLSNTYHLYLRPGSDVIAAAGGLHQFMGWDRPILTDSGGFQVFSLGDLRRITEDGVEFRSHLDGSRHFIGPEDAVRIQMDLGADIIMAFDECAPYAAEREYVKHSTDMTSRWAARCQKAHTRSDQAMFGIIQGGMFHDLRRESAEELTAMDFPGYAVGGLSVGEPKPLMYEILDELVPHIPQDKPRYLMGVGSPDALVEGVFRGIDMFDCVLPTRIARHGTVLTRTGKFAVRDLPYARDFQPIEKGCGCYTCQHHSRAYIRHLFKAKEMLGYRLTTIHNIHCLLALMADIREAIRQDGLSQFRDEFFAEYAG